MKKKLFGVSYSITNYDLASDLIIDKAFFKIILPKYLVKNRSIIVMLHSPNDIFLFIITTRYFIVYILMSPV